jgi:hypothetical protein
MLKGMILAAVFHFPQRADTESLSFILLCLVINVFSVFFTGQVWRCAFILAVFLPNITVRGLGEWIL